MAPLFKAVRKTIGRFEKRKVLITGAARGIGFYLAAQFGEEGASLIICDRDAENLQKAASELERKGFPVRSFVLDVTDREGVFAMAREVAVDPGVPDVLVNNAGVGYHAPLADTPFEAWKKLIDVNLLGAINHVEAFLPCMIERRSGMVINISSGQAFFRLPTWGAYAAVKAAMGAWSETLHIECRPFRVHVLTVYPFMVNTSFYDNIRPNSAADRLLLRLRSLYSQDPQTVARIIVDAAARYKRVEKVHPLNLAGYYMHFIPDVSVMVGVLGRKLLLPSPNKADSRAGRNT